MKSLYFMLYLYIHCVLFPSCSSSDLPQIFKLGLNVGRVDFYDSGSIGVFQKTTRIPITVEPCRRLTYVEVAVYNNYSTPTVSLEFESIAVVIKYRLFQLSSSRYEIIAKTVPLPSCKKDKTTMSI
ncbi:uncharacterized protein LOC124544485 [Vanessa cardui]|uniref:uncharacterized protein LOC124544485 n=1 Tax=Vanessa cardui TaxID=171605 RepID=UPI001F14776C|nr:uncharacterized protein LOC124544485 [Vanessa cardui]